MDNSFSFGLAGSQAVDFSNPFTNPSELAKQPASKEPLTPVSNSRSTSRTDSFSSVVEKRVKAEEDDEEQTAQLKRKKSEPREETNEKRKVLLQKNRVAAQKCRQKKKKETEGMMQSYEYLETENEKLKRETKQLTEETNNLKMMIMSHVGSTPGCDFFNQWIDSQAQAVINKKIHSSNSLKRGPPDNGGNESTASSTFVSSAELSPRQEPSFTFDDELDAPPTSWAMQPQSMAAMDTSFTAPYSDVSLESLQTYDPIDPSLTMAFSPAIKDESEYSYHSLPVGGTPETSCTSPPTVRSATRDLSLAEDSAMVSLPE